MALPKENTEKRRGNPNWEKGKSGNLAGRPRVLDKDKKNNKQLRSDEFMSLVRKFKPHMSRAVMTAVEIMENKESSEAGRLRASALLIQTYKELVAQLYDYRYDSDEGEEIQQNNAPIFSLRMVGGKEEEKQE
jgi:hypothetical protein